MRPRDGSWVMERTMVRRMWVAAAVTFAVVGAACASKSATGAGGTSPGSATSATGQTGNGGGGYGGGYGGGSTTGSAANTVQQGAGGFVFSPSTLTVAKGSTITVTNVGSAPHTFTISGQGIDVVNDPGKSQPVTIDLASGTYTFICRFHESLGMKGTLTVTS
jgi:plastocyanin